jgi:site-specific DNA recombinase
VLLPSLDRWVLTRRSSLDGWGEVQAQRIVAEARLRQGSGRQRMTAEEITRVVSSLRDLMSVLASADPADKAQIYSQLGLALAYHPGSQTVRTEARPLPIYVGKCPRGDSPLTYMPAIAGELFPGT